MIGSIGAAIAGITGQLTTFRDKGHRVTRRARWVLAAVGLSASLTLLGAWLADHENAVSSAARQEELLRNFWQQASLFNAADVRVLVSYSFEPSVVREPPTLFRKNRDLTLRIALRGKDVPNLNPWNSGRLLPGQAVDLHANAMSANVRLWHTATGDLAYQFGDFGSFTGETTAVEFVQDLTDGCVQILIRRALHFCSCLSVPRLVVTLA